MYFNNKITAIVVAAGSSSRMGFDKLFYKINGKEILYHSVIAMASNKFIDDIIVVVSKENYDKAKNLFININKPINFVLGGKDRNNSVLNGVNKAVNSDYIVIHDGARPFVTNKVINDTLELAIKYDGATCYVEVKDTIKVSGNKEFVDYTLDRNKLVAIQTPQIFNRDKYLKAVTKTNEMQLTDDCMIFENAGYKVALSKGDYNNIKITTIEDLPKMNTKIRIGHGYDVHKLVENRDLILGGVLIPYEKGLLGHSDADVLAHVISDALLGALALGDIGKHFPDTDEKYKDADSLILLSKVVDLINEKGYSIQNIDATVICQLPKLAPYILDIRDKLAKIMNISIDDVSVKATTEEKLGFTGAGQGISAHAVCILIGNTI